MHWSRLVGYAYYVIRDVYRGSMAAPAPTSVGEWNPRRAGVRLWTEAGGHLILEWDTHRRSWWTDPPHRIGAGTADSRATVRTDAPFYAGASHGPTGRATAVGLMLAVLSEAGL